jgi:hypothetical protein
VPPRDNVPWDRFWVYGAKDARAVPKLVRRVGQLRGSRRVRSEAMSTLESCLEHQGGLSPATVHVIPRLFAILRERPGRPWQRERMLDMLALFAVPQAANLNGTLVDPETDYAGLDPRCFHACADPEIARACFLAVEEGVPSIMHMLADPSERVARAAKALVALFRKYASAGPGGGA